jgi:hypothetical protein
MFTFIVDHKLRVVEVVLGLMRSIWRKVLGFRIISSQKHIIFMQFFWFFVSWTSDSKKTGEGVGSGFSWSNHRTGLVFKTMMIKSLAGGEIIEARERSGRSVYRPATARDTKNCHPLAAGCKR